jgi:translation elongation factor P/translation initiation factor 5A
MKTTLLKLAALTLALAVMLTIAACSPSVKGTEDTTVIETADGAIIVDTFTTTATVTGINADKREVMLVAPDGRKTTYKAGPEVVNFSQLQVGDQVKAVFTEEVAVAIGNSAATLPTGGSAVALAPVGAKPGGVMVETANVTAKVTAVDAKKHKVTFQLADGTSKTVKAGKKVDVSGLNVGDSVSVQVGEGVLITAEKA